MARSNRKLMRSRILNSNRLLPAALIAAPLLGFVLAGIVIYQTREVETLRREVEILNAEKTRSATSTVGVTSSTVQTNSGTISTTAIQQPEPILDGVSTSTREKLEGMKPPTGEYLFQAKELEPGRVVALYDQAGSRSWEKIRSAWLIDVSSKIFQKISDDINVGYGNDLALESWDEGVVARAAFSPGEAVATLEDTYVSQTGEVLGVITFGDYERDAEDGAADIVARFGGRTYRILPVLDEGVCSKASEGYFDKGEDRGWWDRSTTTMRAVDVNGVQTQLPQPISFPCDVVYGGGYTDPELSYPTFDGHFMAIHIPGYDMHIAVMGADLGSVSFVPRYRYLLRSTEINNERSTPLVGEDQSGYFMITDNAASDPVLAKLLQKNADGEEPYIYPEDVYEENGIVIFRLELDRGAIDQKYATIEYNVATKKFQNPRILETE